MRGLTFSSENTVLVFGYFLLNVLVFYLQLFSFNIYLSLRCIQLRLGNRVTNFFFEKDCQLCLASVLFVAFVL